MTIQKLYDVLKAIAGLAGVVAFITFGYTYYKDAQLRQKLADQNWQAVQIFGFVESQGASGASFGKIVENVGRALIQGQRFNEINPQIATEDQIRRGIVELLSQNALALSEDGNYRVPVWFSRDYRYARLQLASDNMAEYVQKFPGKFNSEELKAWLISEQKLTDVEANNILGSFTSSYGGPPYLVPANDDDGQPFNLRPLRVNAETFK